MEGLTLTTPALLFSAVSLILLAYTNRFLAYAQVVRNLHADFKKKQDTVLLGQIRNLRRRLRLTQLMQVLGISSLLLCVFCMFLIYVHFQVFCRNCIWHRTCFVNPFISYFNSGNTDIGKSTRPPFKRYGINEVRSD